MHCYRIIPTSYGELLSASLPCTIALSHPQSTAHHAHPFSQYEGSAVVKHWMQCDRRSFTRGNEKMLCWPLLDTRPMSYLYFVIYCTQSSSPTPKPPQ